MITDTFLEFLPAGVSQLELKDGSLEADKSVSLYGPTSSDVVLMPEFMPQTSWGGAQKVGITMLDDAMSSL